MESTARVRLLLASATVRTFAITVRARTEFQNATTGTEMSVEAPRMAERETTRRRMILRMNFERPLLMAYSTPQSQRMNLLLPRSGLMP